MAAGSAKMSDTDRIAEKKRVDDFINKRLAERRDLITKQKSVTQPKMDYPLPVALLGKGFMNLYDVLRGQEMRYK